jgi:hypothetical protein
MLLYNADRVGYELQESPNHGLRIKKLKAILLHSLNIFIQSEPTEVILQTFTDICVYVYMNVQTHTHARTHTADVMWVPVTTTWRILSG